MRVIIWWIDWPILARAHRGLSRSAVALLGSLPLPESESGPGAGVAHTYGFSARAAANRALRLEAEPLPRRSKVIAIGR